MCKSDQRQADALTKANLEQFRQTFSVWVSENFEQLEAGGLGDYQALAARLEQVSQVGHF